jgi:hypothetical protein
MRKKVAHARFSAVFVGLLASGVSACATAPFPLKHVLEAQTAISAAEAVGAPEIPQAALHLKMARDQVQSAEKYIADEEPEKARFMLLRAKVDAELAQSLTREAVARARAEEATTKLDELETDTPAES